MKKNFKEPKVDFIRVNNRDVIATSGEGLNSDGPGNTPESSITETLFGGKGEGDITKIF